VTVLGYAGRLFFAFNADTNRVPDFDRLAEALDEEIEAIGRVAQSDRPALRAVAGGGASAWRGRPLSGPRPTRAD
jgi:hypothetical protein